jgi:hypothetical protein
MYARVCTLLACFSNKFPPMAEGIPTFTGSCQTFKAKLNEELMESQIPGNVLIFFTKNIKVEMIVD